MQSSPASSSSPTAVRCLGCGREFETEQVVLLGQTFPAERYCELCRTAEEVVDAQRLAEMRWARVRVPTNYDGCTFENFEPVPGTQTALAVCEQWVKEYRAGTRLSRGLLLRGRPGSGKTHLAVAMLRQLVWSDHPRTALFINVPQWLDALRESSERIRDPGARRPRRRGLVVALDAGSDLPDPEPPGARAVARDRDDELQLGRAGRTHRRAFDQPSPPALPSSIPRRSSWRSPAGSRGARSRDSTSRWGRGTSP